MEALIIIDVQNDFCADGALEVPDGEKVVPVINALSGRFSLTVATQDWHPRGHVSFASAHGRNPGETIKLSSDPQMLWPDHCVQGSEGADFHPNLDLQAVNMILRKGSSPHLDSYSAFQENDHRTTTGLTAYLRGMRVSRVYLCGLATDYCVYFSAIDAVEAGFDTVVLMDAVRAVDIPAGNLDKALAAMRQKGIRLMQSKKIHV